MLEMRTKNRREGKGREGGRWEYLTQKNVCSFLLPPDCDANSNIDPHYRRQIAGLGGSADAVDRCRSLEPSVLEVLEKAKTPLTAALSAPKFGTSSTDICFRYTEMVWYAAKLCLWILAD
jgi:hypothetical protein